MGDLLGNLLGDLLEDLLGDLLERFVRVSGDFWRDRLLECHYFLTN